MTTRATSAARALGIQGRPGARSAGRRVARAYGHHGPHEFEISLRRPVSDTVTGFPGALGVVEGIARVLAGPEDGERGTVELLT